MDIGITTIGTILNVIGSVLLAIRVKILLNWIALVLRAHEVNFNAITQVINNPVRPLPVIQGMTKKLEKIKETKGQMLFVLGLLFIAFGVIFQMVGIYLKLNVYIQCAN